MAEEPRTVEALIDRIATARAHLHSIIAPLDTATLAGTPDATGWTIKDHLAHLAAWERSMVYALQGRPRHEGMGVSEATYLNHDSDDINSELYHHLKGMPPEEVLTELARTQDDMSRLLAGFTTTELEQPYSHFLPGEPGEDRGIPMGAYVSGNTWAHYEEHSEMIERLLKASGA